MHAQLTFEIEGWYQNEVLLLLHKNLLQAENKRINEEIIKMTVKWENDEDKIFIYYIQCLSFT